MRSKHQQQLRRLRHSLAWLVLAAGAARLPAQDLPWGVYEENPLWFEFVPQLKYIKTDVEAEQTSYKPVGGARQEWTELTVMPSVGIQWNNYIYDPYLLTYSLLFEPGYYWQQTGSAGQQSRMEELMLDGSATVNLLTVKPYATTVSYGRSHEEVQSDFFTSQTADLQSWNVLSGYRAGAVPVTVKLNQSEEDRTGDNQEFVTDQFQVGLNAVSDRANADATILDYQFSQYDSQSTAGSSRYSSESASHQVNLTDSEHFQKNTLSSMFNFNERESEGSSADDLNASCNYNVEHTPRLRSFYSYSVSDSSGNGYDSVQNSLMAGINHQLYDSLGTHLDVHGSYAENDSDGTSQDSLGYGTTGAVNYSKRLGDWAHLSVNNSASYDVTDEHSRGGELVIPDESYAIPATGPMIIRLNTPNDLSIASITKNNVPLDASEWTAITTSNPWQIQFFSGGVHSVTNGDSLSITYVVQPNPSGSYSTVSYTGETGLRFWHDRAGVRAGYMTTQNQTDTSDFVLQNIEQYQLGADVNWHGFHADASYTDQRSSLYSYQNYALDENYTAPVFLHSAAGINCNQQWNTFPAGSGEYANQTETLAFYSYMMHYEWHPLGAFNLNAEAGLQQQRGGMNDQDLYAARIYLNWAISKLEVHLGYEHENRQYVSDVYTRDYIFLRMRRSF
jgi:hypothetical protein